MNFAIVFAFALSFVKGAKDKNLYCGGKSLLLTFYRLMFDIISSIDIKRT